MPLNSTAPLAAGAPAGLRRPACQLALLAAATALVPAWAQEGGPPAAADAQRRLFVDGGRAAGDAALASVGVQLPWAWRRPFLGGELTGHWDAHVAHWRIPGGTAAGPGERRAWTQLALVPTLRLRFGGGRSPWFMEGGIGVSVLDGHYATRHKAFSTRFNFTDHQGVGLNFGAHWQHEVMLLVRHVSNGGIRKPNPGENFVQLRYALAF